MADNISGRTNILCITRTCRPDAGGMERFGWELINQLKNEKHLRVKVLAHTGARHTAPFFALSVFPQALSAARRADVVHLGDPLLSLVGWLIKKLFGKPTAITVHGLDITYRNVLYQLYLRCFFRHFDLYLPISRHVDELLAAHRVTGRRHVINPNIFDRYYDPSITRTQLKQLLTTHYKLQTSQKVLLTTGRLVKRKGHVWFITEILPHVPRAVYLIAGGGPEAEAIAAAARTARVDDRVVMLGRVSDDALKVLYNAADVFVQPNVAVPADVEGFGLVLLEAAACARPVLASRLDGIPDAIHDGHNGTLIAPGNKRGWRERLTTLSSGAAARRYTLAHFTWPQAAQQYAQALAQLASRHSTVRSRGKSPAG